MEQMEKKNGEKRGARLTAALVAARWHGHSGKRGQGALEFNATWRGKWGRERGPRAR
jgi:hypothetical protein